MAELEPVAAVWRVIEQGSPKTYWVAVGTGDEAGWKALAEKCPDRFSIEYCDLVPQSALSSAQSAIAERDARIAELERERDAFRGVLEGAEYGDLAGIAKYSQEEARELGRIVAGLSKELRARAEAAEALLKEAKTVLEPFASGRHEMRNTHLLDWLPEGYDHCRLGSKDWAQSYLNSAKDYIKAFESAARSLASKIGGGE